MVYVIGDQTKDGSETLTSFRQALFFKDLGFNVHDTMIYQTDKPPLTHNRYEQSFEYMFVFSKGAPKTFNPIMEPAIHAGTNKKTSTFRQQSNILTKPKKGEYTVKPAKIKQNVWYYPTGYLRTSKDKIAFDHPATFPEKLAEDHIFSWSNEKEIIYDPFGGSGTTAKMAHLLNRNWIISEISKEYAELAAERMKPYLNQGNLFF